MPSPRYLVMASHYLSGQQPRESVLVTTVVFLERKASSKPAVRIYIYIYLYSSFFRINRLVKEYGMKGGEREREDFDISKKRFLERKIAKHEKEDTERDRERGEALS